MPESEKRPAEEGSSSDDDEPIGKKLKVRGRTVQWTP